MSIRHFQEWRAYADLEPFDEERADLRAAQIVQALFNLQGRKKGQAPYRLTDFVLRFGTAAAPKPKSVEQARAEIRRTMDILMLIYNTPDSAAKPQQRRVRRDR